MCDTAKIRTTLLLDRWPFASLNVEGHLLKQTHWCHNQVDQVVDDVSLLLEIWFPICLSFSMQLTVGEVVSGISLCCDLWYFVHFYSRWSGSYTVMASVRNNWLKIHMLYTRIYLNASLYLNIWATASHRAKLFTPSRGNCLKWTFALFETPFLLNMRSLFHTAS